MELTESLIIDLIAKNQNRICTTYDVLIPNCYTSHDNEADVFAIRKSGICDEFEVKLSRSDFLNDAKKIVQYRDCEYWGRNPESCGNKLIDAKWMDENKDKSHKERKKMVAPWQKLKYDALLDGDMMTNYFWYVTPAGVVDISDIPEFAGVIFVEDNNNIKVKRHPKKLHKGKISIEDKFFLVRKLAFRFWEYRLGSRK